MTLRTKLEIGSGILFAVLAGLYGWEALQKHDAVLTANVKAQALEDAQAKLETALKARDEQYQKDSAVLHAQIDALSRVTPQQIVAKAPEHLELPKPIIISSDNAPRVVPQGSAIVPDVDIKPIARAILEGEQCKLDRAKCQADLTDWQAKDKLHTQEAEQWKTVAKGGSVWKRVKKAAIYIGIGAAAGYVAARH